MMQYALPSDIAQIRVYTDMDNPPQLEARFVRAIKGIRLGYRPIVHASTAALYGCEALVWSGEPALSVPPALLDAAIDLGRLAVLGRTTRSLAAAALATRTGIALVLRLHPADLDDGELFDDASPLTAVAQRVILRLV
jgi:EAL domain-containing protein (putative c-di-GMP-specific phosphodiesterase class I)